MSNPSNVKFDLKTTKYTEDWFMYVATSKGTTNDGSVKLLTSKNFVDAKFKFKVSRKIVNFEF